MQKYEARLHEWVGLGPSTNCRICTNIQLSTNVEGNLGHGHNNSSQATGFAILVARYSKELYVEDASSAFKFLAHKHASAVQGT